MKFGPPPPKMSKTTTDFSTATVSPTHHHSSTIRESDSPEPAHKLSKSPYHLPPVKGHHSSPQQQLLSTQKLDAIDYKLSAVKAMLQDQRPPSPVKVPSVFALERFDALEQRLVQVLQHFDQDGGTSALQQQNAILREQNKQLQNELESQRRQMEADNAALRKSLEALRAGIVETNNTQIDRSFEAVGAPSTRKQPGMITVVVLGASGDLAKRKIYPGLFSLFRKNPNFVVVGYARTQLTDSEFYDRLHPFLPQDSPSELSDFLSACSYVSGAYDVADAFSNLNQHLMTLEHDENPTRVFYLALPPSQFVPACSGLKECCSPAGADVRVVVEKPFGEDLESCRDLCNSIGKLYAEQQVYRIDHFLGKEMVQNFMCLRFSNAVFEPLFHRNHVQCVIITVKEKIGVEGRGGYFDSYGILRDLMQNHMLQLLALIAMEAPSSLEAEAMRDEKVKVLSCVQPASLANTVVGQYITDGTNDGYLDDPSVPSGSLCPTYCATVLHINNSRWDGVPFILKCGKALNERKTEVRVQFRQPPATLYPSSAPNELVLRVQPNEAVYMKITNKQPGSTAELVQTELDMSFAERFENVSVPEAYERLLGDVLRGEHENFVRADELEASWAVFTPLLKQLEGERIPPLQYVFGTRGPSEGDDLARDHGFRYNTEYNWSQATQK